MVKRSIIKMVQECAEKSGLEFVDVVQGITHNKVYLKKGDLKRFVVVANSTSDPNQARNIIQDMKRTFR